MKNIQKDTRRSQLKSALPKASVVYSSDFPALRRLVGEDFFESLVEEFRESSRAFRLNPDGIRRRFVEFLGDHIVSADLPYIPELAVLECRVIALMESKDVIKPCLTKVSKLSERSFVSSEYEINPTIELMNVHWNIEDLWMSSDVVSAEEKVGILALYSVDSKLHFLRLSEDEARTVKYLQKGLSISDVIRRFNSEHSKYADFSPERIEGFQSSGDPRIIPPFKAWIESWIKCGIVTGVVLDH